MSTRNSILDKVRKNQPAKVTLPVINFSPLHKDVVEGFATTLKNIGGEVVKINSKEAVLPNIRKKFPEARRVVSVPDTGSNDVEVISGSGKPHYLENVDVAIIKSSLGIAENGAIWVTETDIIERVLPFICQHLVVLIESQNIVPLMHDAYEVIGDMEYGFGTFIAGPSKTADIEQSLVMGAHGPKSLTVFLLLTAENVE